MNIRTLLVFSLGAAVGSAVSCKYFKTKYERIAQEEIDSVKERYCVKKEPTTDLDEDANTSEEPDQKEKYVQADKEMLKQCMDIINESNYAKEVKPMNEMKPFVIPPEEFDELGYDVVSLVYYADGVLIDDNDDIIEDIENTVSEHALTTFGDYEDDSVYVRNHQLQIDYEILLDVRTYEEARKLEEKINSTEA